MALGDEQVVRAASCRCLGHHAVLGTGNTVQDSMDVTRHVGGLPELQTAAVQCPVLTI
jgi:hypothetical protein